MAFPRLNVRIIQANDLLEDADGHCDPYCELQLGETCFKTPTKWRTSNPVWGKYYTFPVSNPNAQFLELRFFDYDLLKKDAWLGCLSIRLDQLQKGVAVTKTFPLQQVAHGSITLELCAIDFGQLCAPVHHAAFIAPPFIQQQQPFIPVATTGIYPTPGLPYQQQVPSPSPVIVQDHHHHHFHEHHHKDDKHHFFHRHESSSVMDNKATKKNKMTDNGYSHYQDAMNSSSSSAPYPMAAAPFSQMNLPNQAPPGAYSYPPTAMNAPMNPNVPPTVITTSTTTTKATHSTDQKDKKKEKTTEKCKSNQWNQTQSGYSGPPSTDYYRQPSIPPPPPFQNPMYNQQQYPGNNNYMPPPPPPPPQQQYPGPHFPYPAPDYNYHYQQHQQQHQQNQQSSKTFESKSFESKKKECTCQSSNSPPDSLLHHLHLQQQKKASSQQYGSTAGLPYPTNLPPMPPIV